MILTIDPNFQRDIQDIPDKNKVIPLPNFLPNAVPPLTGATEVTNQLGKYKVGPGSSYKWSYNHHKSGQIIATSAEVTPNGGVVRESSQNPLNSGLGIIVICPDKWAYKWVTGVISLLTPGTHLVITLFITGKGPPCGGPISLLRRFIGAPFHSMFIMIGSGAHLASDSEKNGLIILSSYNVITPKNGRT